ncbi:hypothetical protein JOC54_001436 [Alkalihalobacillus xiaoxiensis]|uniref:Uncharacterized protein n=1 Tax=Shouchella xiaoxiensis TaxID=766895 RepID=A0ABS2SSI2_9BACI|nr:hypothetical protein [Shouchella xiaoxiensis]MBM7838205.1 hypothetical protein [Shouchella xiaoxiensis]
MKQIFKTNSVILNGSKQEILYLLKQTALTHEYVSEWLQSTNARSTRPNYLKRIK